MSAGTRAALAAMIVTLAAPCAARADAPAQPPAVHAVLLKKSGQLADVAVVVYGRAFAAVVPSVKGVPPRARDDLR